MDGKILKGTELGLFIFTFPEIPTMPVTSSHVSDFGCTELGLLFTPLPTSLSGSVAPLCISYKITKEFILFIMINNLLFILFYFTYNA